MTADPTIISKTLFKGEMRDSYSSVEKFQDHILEQYKLYLESADRISTRRQIANSFFVAINTTLVSVASYAHQGGEGDADLYWLIALAGIVVSYMWYRLVRSYRDLNTAKFNVVHEIEKGLPISPYDAEWEYVGRGKDSSLYLPFTQIEIGVPWVFIALHVIVFAKSFPWHYLKIGQ